MNEIKENVEWLLKMENIQSKEDLDKWCGDKGRQKLYEYIEKLAARHWNRIKTPKSSVNYYYQKVLSGYKIYINND